LAENQLLRSRPLRVSAGQQIAAEMRHGDGRWIGELLAEFMPGWINKQPRKFISSKPSLWTDKFSLSGLGDSLQFTVRKRKEKPRRRFQCRATEHRGSEALVVRAHPSQNAKMGHSQRSLLAAVTLWTVGDFCVPEWSVIAAGCRRPASSDLAAYRCGWIRKRLPATSPLGRRSPVARYFYDVP